MATYSIRFTVNGSGEFPMDMLRYDSCYPRGSDDAYNISHTFQRYTSDPDASKLGDALSGSRRRPITLVHVTTNKHWRPTAGRWSSFLWGVDLTSIEVTKID